MLCDTPKFFTLDGGEDFSEVVVGLRPRLVSKNFQDFPLHRIFGHMHGALNIDEKTNYTVW
jgi:hypothetical protein